MMSRSKIFGKIPAEGTGKWRLPLALALIAGLTVAVYWPVLRNEFISYDDTDYVTLNMVVRQGLTLKGFLWAFSAYHAGNWHPLTWLSHMLDIEFFDLGPAGHHAISLLLHTVNSVLLCALLHRMTGFIGRSLFVALLFAVHPLHVESVAWVAERKDVLSTLFWLLTMMAYAGYVRKPCLKRYVPVALFFALGLMAKQMLVTLPFVLLLMDHWPLNRIASCRLLPQGEDGGGIETGFKRLLAEKIPLIAMSAVAAIITLSAQKTGGALAPGDGQSSLLYAGNALISYLKYIGKMFWPTDLALFYPFEPSAVTPLKVAGSLAILALITAIAVLQRGKRPYLAFGWFWYLITLLPVIGFVKVGSQAMADRYTYIPLIGLFLIVAWGGAEALGKWRNGLPVAGGAAIVIAILSVLTFVQVGYWRSSYSLFSHALAVVERNWLAHNNLGILLAQHYRYDEAIRHFRESVRLNPNGASGFRNLGNACQAVGRNNEAIEAFREAVRIDPNDVEGHYRLGYAYLLGGNMDLAYQEYLRLLRLDESRARPLLDSIRMKVGK